MVKTAFEELGLEGPDDFAAKSRLVALVSGEFLRRGLADSAAGNILGLDQPNVSALMNEKISRFSVEKLMSLAARLGFSVSIHFEGRGVQMAVPMPSAA